MPIRLFAMLALILFGGYTLWVMAISEQPLLEFGAQLMGRPDTAQVVIDLYLACALIGLWMYQDNRRQGRSLAYLLPFYLLTAVFASIGPLLYLVLRTPQRQES
ncbi:MULTISPECIES: DUF2834 domain-containing protein [unclassified Pseudomonas]|uniref:DUF2834 domain-containing protein n=1 Tax=unclassified Pseudomonas TaxID=196821 RepID=UPI000EAAAEC7|nr:MULTISPECIES: DUF2834 domain-containing protein [unclassified Pseudomonas]AYF86306.1 DUF2834 domain-containing protein [Pseudomonas sp. DY-1]MDH4653898.1 DUF2834 domain-containing protein [Pseudomonas sp. BN606]MRK22697.1 DUF2834 domain-containing protein [Pseudomonas sp. JG-B]